MTLEVKPETKQLLELTLERGRFHSVDDFIVQAISLMQEPEPDLVSAPTAANRILALPNDVQPDPEGWTPKDYINFGRP